MTVPIIEKQKFFVVRPAAGRNQIFNPRFDTPDGVEDWTAFGTGAAIVLTDEQQRHGAYCMKVTPAINLASGAYYASGLQVENGKFYTFSCDVRGAEGQALRITIADSAGTVKASNSFTATGYWQRKEVTWLSNVTIANYRVYVIADAAASSNPFYVDGAQFEQAAKATTFMQGYGAGCRWEGGARNSASIRSAVREGGGELVDLDDYLDVIESTPGLGHGDWNQTVVKMTRGGDYPQGHQLKSRMFSIVGVIKSTDLSDMARKRKALIDLTRPDLTGEEQMIIRYQGIDANGNEATNPIDIYCKPLPDSLKDTADLPSSQRVAMHFTIPSGLLDGAYEEGKELDLFAEFPANYIVKRDANGNWCKWTGAAYENFVKGLGIATAGRVNCILEIGGKIYVGGKFASPAGVTGADNFARFDPVTERWEAIVSVNGEVTDMDWTPPDTLFIAGNLTNVGGVDATGIARINWVSGSAVVDPNFGTAEIWSGGTGGAFGKVSASFGRQPFGHSVYYSGRVVNMGGVEGASYFVKWSPTSLWSKAISTDIAQSINFKFSPNDILYIAGTGSPPLPGAFMRYDTENLTPVDPNNRVTYVNSFCFDELGNIFVSGNFTEHPNDHVRMWNGTQWIRLGEGLDKAVRLHYLGNGEVIALGNAIKSGSTEIRDAAIWKGGLWMPLDVNLLESGADILHAIKASDGSLYLGGEFSSSGDANFRTGIAALNLNVASASANTHPFIQVHGPGKLISIRNHTTEKSVEFNDLTLQDGESVNLLFDPLNLRFESGWANRGNLTRSVLPGSDAGDFFLKPGVNHLSVFMEETTDNSGAFIFWRPKFWGLDGAVYE